MMAILGQYYYAPHRRSFGVWQWTEVSETGACGTFIKDFRSKDEAREFVWQQNGWGTCSSQLMKATQNGRGLSGDQVNTIKYWDVEKGGYRSLRYENLIQVF